MSREFGWAYVVGSQASGPKGSVQLAGVETALDHDPNLVWSDDLNALLVSGNIIAHNFEIQNQTKTVFEFEVSGSSIFGDTPDDLHQFTGSIDTSGTITAHSFIGYGGDLEGVAVNTYETQRENHLILGAGPKAIKTVGNLSYTDDTLYVTGAIQTDELSSSLAYFDSIDSENIDANVLTSQQATLTQTTATFLTSSNMMFGDIVLTGRIIDANGKVLMSTPTAETEQNISTTSAGLTSITSAAFSSISNTSITGLEYAIVEDGLEVGGDNLVVRDGKVSIGTNHAARKVEIFDEASSQLRLSSVGTENYNQSGFLSVNLLKEHTDLGTNGNGDFHILPTNGRVGINTETPNYSLDVQGDVGISGDLYVTGTLHARTTDFIVSADTMILGDAATDEVVVNASTMTTPNGLTIDNDLFISGSLIGIGSYSSGSKLEVTAPANQFKVGNLTKSLSVSVNNTSTTLSTDNSSLDIASDTKVLGELIVGSNGDIILDNAGQVSSSVSVSSHSGYFTNLTSSNITNGNTLISSDSIETPLINTTTINSTNVNATSVNGTLLTQAQPNITSLGTLTSLNVANAANIGGPLGINISNPSRMVEIKDSSAQLRLTNTIEMFGLTSYTYTDLKTTTSGDLSIEPTSGKVIVPSLNLTNVQQGTSNNFLSLDQDGNVILAPAVQSGIEVRNRVVVSQNYNVSSDDYFIGIQATQNLTVTLPDASTLFNGQIMVLKDESENADQYTIQITALQGQLIENRQSITFASAGSAVNIYTDGISKFFIM